MTDQTAKRKLESFSSMEVLSVVAMLLILLMIAIPFPYANRNHWLAATHKALGQENAAADARSGDTLESSGAGETAPLGFASQGSPFEVRTVGRREFCADMPGVVRFSTASPRCRNGKLLTNAQLRREQLGH